MAGLRWASGPRTRAPRRGTARSRGDGGRRSPVCSTRVADVWLKNEQAASRPQHSPDRGECPQEVLLCKEMLEEVTRKHAVDQFVRQRTEVGTDSLDDLDAGASMGSDFLAKVPCSSTTGYDVGDGLTIASGNIESGVTGVDMILEEVPTEDLPNAVLNRPGFPGGSIP